MVGKVEMFFFGLVAGLLVLLGMAYCNYDGETDVYKQVTGRGFLIIDDEIYRCKKEN